MFKVLIADDEPMIREGLKSLIDWADYGFEIAGTAANGKEAADKQKELQPDLILVDIRMPIMDGLEAIAEMRRTGADCHIVILSGYAEFDYARQAIAMGVDGYLLKPIDEEELESCVARISEGLRQQSGGASSDALASALLRDDLLQRLAEGRLEVEPDENETAGLFGSEPGPCRAVLAELYSREHSLTVKSVVRKRLAELAADNGWTFAAEPYIGLLVKSKIPTAAVEGWLQEACPDKVRFTAVMSGPSRQFLVLQSDMMKMKESLKHRFLLQGDKLYAAGRGLDESERGTPAVRFGKPESDGSSAMPEDELEELPRKLFYMVDIGNKPGLTDTVNAAAAPMLSSSESEQSLKSHWAAVTTEVLNRAGAAHPGLSVKEHLSMVTELYLSHHYGEMLERLAGRLAELANKIAASSGDGVSAIKRITDFIERHYAEPIKLETLAELFHYNSGYLGKLFRSQTGEHFNTYLDKVRIRHAVELLKQGSKVHQAAQLVGYANADYLHAKFKKYMGMSPSAFKGAGPDAEDGGKPGEPPSADRP